MTTNLIKQHVVEQQNGRTL